MGDVRVLKTPEETVKLTRSLSRENKTVGFVPTMGYFHEGHLNLMRRARKECDIVVASIFVNPIQFGPNEDLAKYPRDLERDAAMAASAGVDYIFNPEPGSMYGPGFQSNVQVCGLSKGFCGDLRPGHFDGVCTVVAKLFNIVNPDYAYFGMKDYQQLVVIERMVRDLNFGVRIVRCDITREPDGLAMSSRNVYLSPEERRIAPEFQKALAGIKGEVVSAASENKEFTPDAIIKKYSDKLIGLGFGKIDYLEIADASDLIKVKDLSDLKKSGNIFVAGALYLGKTRLIDNIVFPLENAK